MPNTAKLLRFPVQPGVPLSREQAQARANEYLDRVTDVDGDPRRAALLAAPDVLLMVCVLLRDKVDCHAELVSGESVALYRHILGSTERLGAFDEKDYFLGETALLAATANRVLGRRSETELWLDRAEAGFRHTVNPSPLLANVTYQRLALRCESGRFEEVVELAPMLAASFSKQNMVREEAKCVLLEAIALKQGGKHDIALARFESLKRAELIATDPGLVGMALVNIADIHVAGERDGLAEAAYGEALPLLEQGRKPAATAHLKSAIAETLQRQGRTAPAIDAYQAAVADYAALGMSTWVAYLRLALANVMLAAGQAREAEWQILAALPTIDEEGMLPEGFAAIAMLRESVRRRKTDPKALLEVSSYLQAKN